MTGSDAMDQWTERLSEYLDGGLEDQQRIGLEAHLLTCPQCTTTLEELRQVVAQARRLESRPPEEDLWPGIEARLEPRRSWRIVPWTRQPGQGRRQFTFTFPQLAAASLLLVLLSGGLMWLVLEKSRVRPESSGPIVSPPGPMAQAPAASGSPGSGSRASGSSNSGTIHGSPSPAPAADQAALAAFDTGRYDIAVAELERVLNENRSRLDPATVRTIEQNLRIIDQAISQARKALDADPANPYLNGHLAEQMNRKIKLLQLASQVVTAHS